MLTKDQLSKFNLQYDPLLKIRVLNENGEIKHTFSPAQSTLLEFLIKNENQLVSFDDIIERIYGDENNIPVYKTYQIRILDVYLSHIRKYLTNDIDYVIKRSRKVGVIFCKSDL